VNVRLLPRLRAFSSSARSSRLLPVGSIVVTSTAVKRMPFTPPTTISCIHWATSATMVVFWRSFYGLNTNLTPSNLVVSRSVYI